MPQISMFSPAVLKPASNMVSHDRLPPVGFRALLARPLRVRWEGDQVLLSGCARVNRECCLQLLAARDVELLLAEPPAPQHGLGEPDAARFAPVFARWGVEIPFPVDVTVRHQAIPDWRRPNAGRLVVIAPWSYAHLPRAWRDGALQADEVWAPSRFVRDVYVRSGVPAEKVRLVPPGVDPQRFTPDGPQYPLPTRKSVRFLFLGSALERRGADLLLGAYLRAFTHEDDVCLVMKETPVPDPGEGPTLADDFRRAAADPRLPEILVLEEDLTEADLAALYRACSCVALPYRGVGFGLPVLEGMACGLPAIVTAAGAIDDFLDDTMGWRLPCRRRPAGDWIVGPYECVGEPWQIEPDREALVETLRHVYEHPEEARERGQAARAHVAAHWTWDHTVARLRARLHALLAPAENPPDLAATLWHDPEEDETAQPDDAAALPWSEAGGEAAVCSDTNGGSRPVSPSPRRPVELSLCMIVRDEEPRLPRCLASVAPFVDEMVVVDTGSTDRTREVARDYGARVFELPWLNSFSLARNASIDQARGSWILRMDADDVLCREEGPRLRELIHRYPGRSDVAYLMEYRVPPGPDGTGGHVVDQVQLWPNRPDLRFEYHLHEQLLGAVLRAGIYTVRSGLTIHHCNYDWSEEGQAKRRRRDFPLLERDLWEHPDDPFVLFNLGMTHLNSTQEREVAAHYLRRSLEASRGQHGMDRLAYPYLVRARMEQNDWEAALAVNEEGRARFPEHAELLLQAGALYEKLGRPAEARQALERLVLGGDEPQYRCMGDGLRTYRGRSELALLLRRLGRTDHCEQILREVTQTYPFYRPARLELAETLHMLNRPDEAEALLAEPRPSAPVVQTPPPRFGEGAGGRGPHRGPHRRPRRVPLRVTHLVPFLGIGGTEHVILDLCRHGAEEQQVVSTVDGPMRPVFEEHGIPLRVGETWEQVIAYLADADLVNLHLVYYVPELLQAVLNAGRPMVCTLHWCDPLPPMPGPVICVAQHVYDLQEQNRDRRLLIRNGIDTTRFRPSERRSERARIIRVCRPDKCAEYFWPAVHQVLNACPEAELTVVGGFPYQADRVRSLGDRFDVPELLAGADLFAYTPRPEGGAMDLCVLEAMASGLPCVLSDVACVNEAVEHEVTGLLTPYEDLEAFATGLERLTRDRELREAMGARAAQVARERFEVRDRIPLYTAAYEQALDEALLPTQQQAWQEHSRAALAST
jgi:glycosyltransferase involved in cell wall biosynthesis/tetratricopeptide (TPR) repeat protein